MLSLVLWAAAWQSVATPHFHVLSTAPEAETRAALSVLESVRQRAERVTGWRTRGGAVMVRVSGDAESGYRLALGRDWILVRPADAAAAAGEYARLWLRRSGRDLPAWLHEGLARSLAALPIEPVTDPLPLELLLATDFRNVPAAQARLFVEYLRVATGARFPTLLDAMALHQPHTQALEWITGQRLPQMETALAAFRPPAERPDAAEPRATAGPASPWEAEIASAVPLKEAAALVRLREAAGRWPGEAAVWETLAGVETDDARRRAALEQAWKLGTSDAETLWQYSLLLAGAPERLPVLERLVRAAPEHWDAVHELAREALARKSPDRARLLLARLPEASAPEAPEHYRLQSLAARLAQNRIEAAAAAERMAAIARTDTLRREADELARMARDLAEPAGGRTEQGATVVDPRGGALGRAPAVGRPGRPETYGPKETQAPPRPSVEGRLIRVDCRDGAAQLHIETGGAVRQFWVFDARQVVVRSRQGSEVELPCGVLASPARVRAEYEDRDEPLLRLLEFL